MGAAQDKVKRGQTGSVQLKQALALLETGEAVLLPTFTVAQLPAASAANAGRMVRVSNGASGAACLAVSNGAAWVRVLVGAAVSAT
jgi:hypothetical protein